MSSDEMDNIKKYQESSTEPKVKNEDAVVVHSTSDELVGQVADHNARINHIGHNDSEVSQPIYKKWWFWPIAVVMIIVVIGAFVGFEPTEKTKNQLNAASNSKNISSKKSEETIDEKEFSSSANTGVKETPTPATEEEKSELKSLIDEAKTIDVSLYTSASATAFTNALAEAEEAFEDDTVTPSRVNRVVNMLDSAMEDLQEKVQPVVVSGAGDDIIDIPANLSICLVSAEYSSGSNFIIKTLDDGGDPIDLLVNTIGSYSGTTVTGKRSGTPAYLEVSASGPWTITLMPVEDADVLENGQMMFGDNVVSAATNGAKKLTITNSGNGNFIVYGISASSSKLLVNEIGDYSGTVINSNYSLFIVQSEGDWSISWE